MQQETQQRLQQARKALVKNREVLVSAVRPRTSPFLQPTAAITPPMHACFIYTVNVAAPAPAPQRVFY